MKKEERKYAESREEYFREFHSVIAPVVVVDGYMDVLALDQYGINCAVATLGTDTSEHQISEDSIDYHY